MVKNVECIELELEFKLLAQAGYLERAEVKGDVTWPAKRVSAGVPKHLGVGGDAKSIDVEPLLDRAVRTHAGHD